MIMKHYLANCLHDNEALFSNFAKNCNKIIKFHLLHIQGNALRVKVCYTGPRSAVGNVSGYRCVSDCRSRGREFDPGLVTYFRGD